MARPLRIFTGFLSFHSPSTIGPRDVAVKDSASMTARLLLRCVGPTKGTLEVRFSAEDPLLDALLPSAASPPPRSTMAMAMVLCAPSIVARQTADLLGYSPTDEPQLRDLDVGRWAGRSIDEVANAEPEAVAAWLTDPDTAVHGGESIHQFLDRIGTWMRSQLETNASTIGITHPAVIRAAVVNAVGAPAESFWRFDIAPLSLTSLRGNMGRWNLVELAKRARDDGVEHRRDHEAVT